MPLLPMKWDAVRRKAVKQNLCWIIVYLPIGMAIVPLSYLANLLVLSIKHDALQPYHNSTESAMNPLELERQKSVVSTSRRSFLSRTLTRLDNGGVDDAKGPYGLNTLFEPAEPAIADLVFVHGLGGGSRSTWTKSNDPSLYWPQQWLPNDYGFRDIRIHSFGYNSNWDKESALNIHDFAKSLLGSIKDCPLIPRGAKVGANLVTELLHQALIFK